MPAGRWEQSVPVPPSCSALQRPEQRSFREVQRWPQHWHPIQRANISCLIVFWRIICPPSAMFHCRRGNSGAHQGHILPGSCALSVLHPLLFGQGKEASAPLSPLLSLTCMSILIKILLQVTLVLMWNPARFVLVTFYWPSIDLFKLLFPLNRW